MKYVRCEQHFEHWELAVKESVALRDIVGEFRHSDMYYDVPLISTELPVHGFWMIRKEVRAMELDEWQRCYYCGKPCLHRHWMRMETLSGHFDGVHRQFHTRCEVKAKVANEK